MSDMENKLENIWGKVSKGIEDGFKVGKEEIVRTAKIGKTRLDIASLKSSKNEKLKLLGEQAYELLQSGEIKTPRLEPLFNELEEIDNQVNTKEEEIKTILAEKEASEAKIPEEDVTVEKAEIVVEPTPSKPAQEKTKKGKSASTSGKKAAKSTAKSAAEKPAPGKK